MTELVCVNDYENHAKIVLSKTIFEYFQEGAGREETLKNNKDGFTKYRIRPRYLRNVEKRIMHRQILEKEVSMPIGISPTAVQKMAHQDGEIAVVKGDYYKTVGIGFNYNSKEPLLREVKPTSVEGEVKLTHLRVVKGDTYVLNSHSTTNIEEVANAAPKCRKWLQSYLFRSREMTVDIIATAEKTGFEAIVLTCDFPMLGIRLQSTRNKLTLPSHLDEIIIKKYVDKGLITDPEDIADASADWSYIKWMKTITKLPIIAKGILTAEDAILAVEAGVSAILVSNHGARQLDGLPSTIEALPEVVRAVGHKVEVYMDGGIRDGTDVYKALALGARMVFVGRPPIWGLAHNGEEGVKSVLNILRNELDKAMAISGCASLDEVTSDRVVHESYYSKCTCRL